MNDFTHRFINKDELFHIKTLFSIDPRSIKVELTESQVDEMIRNLERSINYGIGHVLMTFRNDGSPYGMYAGFELSRIGGWYIGLTKVIKSANHFNTSSKILAPALNELIKFMEDKGYYKFWMSAPERHHNLRNKIMRKNSFMLNRYDWYDEVIIPKGARSKIDAFEIWRGINNLSSIVVRMFSLQQEYRVEILKKQGHDGYVGTIL